MFYRPFKRNVILIGEPFEFSEFYKEKLDKEILEKADEILKHKLSILYENYKKYLEEQKIVKQLKKSKKLRQKA